MNNLEIRSIQADKQDINLVIKIHDTCFSHEPNFINNTDNITFIRNLKKGGIIDINKNDIVIYTDTTIGKIHPYAKKNIALMIESQELHRPYYDYIEKNNKLFDLVLTFDKKLLDRGENFRLNLYGTTWLNEIYRNIWSKSKICSFIISNKKITSGHRLRHIIVNSLQYNNINFIDIYGGNHKPLQFTQTQAFDKDHNSQHISNQKILGLKDYMFSIVIENCKENYYFTEKIIDCFLSGTIPIYYGCPAIGNFFNQKGILTFDNPNECFNIIKNLTNEKYYEMMPYINENFEKAKKYTTYKINEDEIIKIL
jgi:hypothetical protein